MISIKEFNNTMIHLEEYNYKYTLFQVIIKVSQFADMLIL